MGKIDAFGQYLKKKVIAEDDAQRWRICQGCEYLRTDNRCEICGCFMKLKTNLRNAHCPLRKW